jgi:hypothetical protein
MKSTEIFESRTIINEARTYKLWESVGRKLAEAQLTQDQINQIFQQAEQGMTSAGSNRTMLGKGKDAAVAVNQAWEELKGKIQNTAPIKGFDQLYDQQAEKLKQVTGGDTGVMRYVQKYRKFADEHPIAQGFIYALLIAATGLSGAGVAGAAGLGLFKMADRLVQGDKFSSALYKGGKTGAMAYAAHQLAQHVRGADGSSTDTSSDDTQDSTINVNDFDKIVQRAVDYQVKPGDTLSDILADRRISPRAFSRLDPSFFGPDGNPNVLKAGQIIKLPAPEDIANLNKMSYTTPDVANRAFYDAPDSYVGQYNPNNSLTSLDAATNLKHQMTNQNTQNYSKWGGDNGIAAARAAKDAAKKAVGKTVGKAAGMNPSDLAESQIYLIIGKAVERQRKLDEGSMWDSIKGAASSAGQWAQTKGHNLTTKITADKLLQAWKKAGSPTDSDEFMNVLLKTGISRPIMDKIYNGMNLPVSGGQANNGRIEPTMNPTPGVVQGQTAKRRLSSPKPGAAGAFGNMASTLAKPTQPTFKPTSTGSVAQTSTGMIHAPKASNPNRQAASPMASAPSPTASVKQKLDTNAIMNGIMTLNPKEFNQIVTFMRNQIRKGRGE